MARVLESKLTFGRREAAMLWRANGLGVWALVVGMVLAMGACRSPDPSKEQATAKKKAEAAQDSLSQDLAPKPALKAVEPVAAAAEPAQAPAPAGDGDVEEDQEPAQEAEVKAEDSTVALLRMLRDRAEAHVLWARDLLAREEALKKEAETLTADMARLGVLQAIPETHDLAQVEAEWQGLAQIMGFKIEAWMSSQSILEGRPLPEEIPADKELKLSWVDVRAVHQVVVTLPSMSDDQLKRLLEGVAGFQRLTLVRRVKPEPGGKLTVNAEVYQFNPTTKPKLVVPDRDIESAMAQMGIHLTLSEAVRKDPIGYVQTASLAYQEYSAYRTKAEQVAQIQGQLMWLNGRMDFWKLKTAEVKAVTLERAREARTVGDR